MDSRFETFLKDMHGRAVTVIGLGISNAPLIELLVQSGARVEARDRRTAEQLGELVPQLEGRGVKIISGEDYLQNLSGEIIFRTPGLNRFCRELIEAEERGITITSEMEVFLDVCPCKIIGITGSDGKTTTSTLIAKMLEESGFRIHLGGNIGRPLLADTGDMKPDDIAVLELSSFQLMGMKRSPDIGIITNISPNHLDIHKDMEEYVEAKMNIFRNNPEGFAVFNAGNEYTARALRLKNDPARTALFGWARPEEPAGRLVYCFNDEIIAESESGRRVVLAMKDIKLPGRRNVENYMCAVAAVEGLASPEAIVKVAREFGGVPHRIELVRELDGVKYYNDSIASSPTRAIAGLRSFESRIIMIAGGYDKKIPFDELGPEAAERVELLLLTGPTAGAIRAAVEGAPGFDPAETVIIDCADVPEAVFRAREAAGPGDVVMLCPACASFDAYKNFEERGEHFKGIVLGL